MPDQAPEYGTRGAPAAGRSAAQPGRLTESLRPAVDHDPPEVGAKHAQPLPYGTPEWAQVYHGLRNSIEGFNGFAKSDNHEATERAGCRRVRGIAGQTILLAFQLAHANSRKIAAWADSLPDPETGRPRRRSGGRRDTKPLKHWTPTGRIDSDELQAA